MLFFVLISANALSIKIDGKIWDWGGIKNLYKCKPRLLDKNRSGLDMDNVRLTLGKKFLYILIEGKSVTGQKKDNGLGAHKTSIRISFKSSQSPLNRVRIAADPGKSGVIKISYPSIKSQVFGSPKDKYWAMGKYGKGYAFEFKIPIIISNKGVHVGVSQGPIIKPSKKYEGGRNSMSDVLINSVDIKTHRLVDSVEFTIKKGEL